MGLGQNDHIFSSSFTFKNPVSDFHLFWLFHIDFIHFRCDFVGDVKYFRIDNTTGQLTTFQPFTATTPCLLAFQIKVIYLRIKFPVYVLCNRGGGVHERSVNRLVS